ncbi:MAG: hypothetical protein ABEJ31_11075 [Haloarculaceae archaeon]
MSVTYQQQTARLDELFDVLSNRTRRRILTIVARADGELRPVDLKPADEPATKFFTELYHKHLPRLEEAEYVEWDSEAEVIARGPRFDAIEPVLEALAREDDLPVEWP